MGKSFLSKMVLFLAGILFLTQAHFCFAQSYPKTPKGWDDFPQGFTSFQIMLDSTATYDDAQAMIDKYNLVAVKSLVFKAKDGEAESALAAVTSSDLFTVEGHGSGEIYADTAASKEEVEKFLQFQSSLQPDYACVRVEARCVEARAQGVADAIYSDKPEHFVSLAPDRFKR